MKLINKKAAMFGLDARIALAIFGALSVISGAALYSAIQQSKVTSIIAQLNEVSKAEEQYLLDTGTGLSKFSSGTNDSVRRAEQLVSNTESKTGWNGPYLSFTSPGEGILENSDDRFWVRVGDSSTWGATTDIAVFTSENCTNCDIWIQTIVDSDSIADAIDLQIDGVAGRDSGNIRVRNAGVAGSTKPNIFIKHRPWSN